MLLLLLLLLLLLMLLYSETRHSHGELDFVAAGFRAATSPSFPFAVLGWFYESRVLPGDTHMKTRLSKRQSALRPFVMPVGFCSWRSCDVGHRQATLVS